MSSFQGGVPLYTEVSSFPGGVPLYTEVSSFPGLEQRGSIVYIGVLISGSWNREVPLYT